VCLGDKKWPKHGFKKLAILPLKFGVVNSNFPAENTTRWFSSSARGASKAWKVLWRDLGLSFRFRRWYTELQGRGVLIATMYAHVWAKLMLWEKQL